MELIKSFERNKMKTYFGFAISDSMFSGDVTIRRQPLKQSQAMKEVAEGVISCCNPSHAATIRVMREVFGGVGVSIPDKPPRVELRGGDSIIVMGVRGLPRMTDRHEYTAGEIAQATFSFAKYTIIETRT